MKLASTIFYHLICHFHRHFYCSWNNPFLFLALSVRLKWYVIWLQFYFHRFFSLFTSLTLEHGFQPSVYLSSFHDHFLLASINYLNLHLFIFVNLIFQPVISIYFLRDDFHELDHLLFFIILNLLRLEFLSHHFLGFFICSMVDF